MQPVRFAGNDAARAGAGAGLAGNTESADGPSNSSPAALAQPNRAMIKLI